MEINPVTQCPAYIFHDNFCLYVVAKEMMEINPTTLMSCTHPNNKTVAQYSQCHLKFHVVINFIFNARL